MRAAAAAAATAATRTESCDRLISGDFSGPRRDHMCRACITRCPVSNDVLKPRRMEGAPKRVFWDDEAQRSLVADLFLYRPAFVVWRSAIKVTTSEQTRDGWRLAARREP